MANLIEYGGGMVNIISDNKPQVIEIDYRGKISATSSLSSDWTLGLGPHKILLVNMSLNYDVYELFKYSGELKILNVLMADIDSNLYNLTIKPNVDHWDLMGSKYDEFSQNIDEFSDDFKVGAVPTKSTLIHEGLMAKEEELFYKNGDIYPTGNPYHIHQNGMIMEGAKHTHESKILYKKDAKGVLFDATKALNKTKKTFTKIVTEPSSTTTTTRTTISGGGY